MIVTRRRTGVSNTSGNTSNESIEPIGTHSPGSARPMQIMPCADHITQKRQGHFQIHRAFSQHQHQRQQSAILNDFSIPVGGITPKA
jgi:hypothetical protein